MADLKRILRLDWDAVAGILAAVSAIVMHFLHIVEEGALLMIAVVLIALLFIRALRRERQDELMTEGLSRMEQRLDELTRRLHPPDVLLHGPRDLRTVSEAFAARARGEMIWFNVCLSMFRPQALFDTLLRPAVENPSVRSIQFVLDSSQRTQWEQDVVPKLDACRGKDRVRSPVWTTIHENLSLILADAEAGKTECLLSFWGEPFMASTPGRDVPRYILHVQRDSQLIGRLVDLARGYRVAR
jgi:hypothetical protein